MVMDGLNNSAQISQTSLIPLVFITSPKIRVKIINSNINKEILD